MILANSSVNLVAMKYTIFLIVLFLLYACSDDISKVVPVENQVTSNNQTLRDSIIKKYLEDGAWKHRLYSNEWQEEIDKGLKIDSTIAYLWQQKAMPLFKQGKYQLGMNYLDKAVQYDPKEWLEYRAFMKCIFSKDYLEAIVDFQNCKQRYGMSYVMDHSYDFYIAVCNLQLNNYSEAEKLLIDEIARQKEMLGELNVHHLDLFYLGIANFEQRKYEQAIMYFEEALNFYNNFADAQYYKPISLKELGRNQESDKIFKEAVANGKNGYTINEDNALYERYPYQLRWK